MEDGLTIECVVFYDIFSIKTSHLLFATSGSHFFADLVHRYVITKSINNFKNYLKLQSIWFSAKNLLPKRQKTTFQIQIDILNKHILDKDFSNPRIV